MLLGVKLFLNNRIYNKYQKKNMFLNNVNTKQVEVELDTIKLESLLKCFTNEEILTEQEVSLVESIQNNILENKTIVLDENAMELYEDFIDKVMFFDNQLKEGIIGAKVTGIDEAKLSKIEKKITEAAKDPVAKAKLIEQIDDMIDNSNRIFTSSSPKQWLVGIGLSTVTFGLSNFITYIWRLVNSDDRKEFKEKLMDPRNKVKTAEI